MSDGPIDVIVSKVALVAITLVDSNEPIFNVSYVAEVKSTVVEGSDVISENNFHFPESETSLTSPEYFVPEELYLATVPKSTEFAALSLANNIKGSFTDKFVVLINVVDPLTCKSPVTDKSPPTVKSSVIVTSSGKPITTFPTDAETDISFTVPVKELTELSSTSVNLSLISLR